MLFIGVFIEMFVHLRSQRLLDSPTVTTDSPEITTVGADDGADDEKMTFIVLSIPAIFTHSLNHAMHLTFRAPGRVNQQPLFWMILVFSN